MKILQRYLAGEIIRASVFVLAAFLALFAFFDVMSELQSVGSGGYKLQHAFLFVLMGMPGYAYELMPIAALIGTIYVLAQLASRSEFTIMRVSGLSTRQAAAMLAKIGVLFALLTFVFGEYVAPKSTELGQKLKLGFKGAAVSQEFRSGLWAKDVIRDNGVSGNVIGTRFLNVREMRPTGELLNLRIYEFDRGFHLVNYIIADRADYSGNNTWTMQKVTESRFPEAATRNGTRVLDLSTAVSTTQRERMPLVSEITPSILSVLFADPERMSAADLALYSKHLAENKQRTERYEIAYWRKLSYPFAVFVMMAVALPFAYLHFRAGGVSLKIFAGIMIGVSFQLINRLFSHIGMLNTWPPFATAVLPSVLFLLAALLTLKWIERR
ncbi:LPS export ABC transporter permease LptG [Noviherbaspirillum soli]|uniref:LPS export ABC transporter permease LptG n=1 Tax=Noviherbaspirillum soli TaxID=1064518 RepID=UPI00188CEF49|nr:LPS export ABC transporter permease LptG [Noviherbaspirillum soli]